MHGIQEKYCLQNHRQCLRDEERGVSQRKIMIWHRYPARAHPLVSRAEPFDFHKGRSSKQCFPCLRSVDRLGRFYPYPDESGACLPIMLPKTAMGLCWQDQIVNLLANIVYRPPRRLSSTSVPWLKETICTQVIREKVKWKKTNRNAHSHLVILG